MQNIDQSISRWPFWGRKGSIWVHWASLRRYAGETTGTAAVLGCRVGFLVPHCTNPFHSPDTTQEPAFVAAFLGQVPIDTDLPYYTVLEDGV
jgi:hypothetical protein